MRFGTARGAFCEFGFSRKMKRICMYPAKTGSKKGVNLGSNLSTFWGRFGGVFFVYFYVFFVFFCKKKTQGPPYVLKMLFLEKTPGYVKKY